MKLTSAILYVDCEEIFKYDEANDYCCPSCSSSSCIPLNNFVHSVEVNTVVKVDTEVKLEEKKALANREGALPEGDEQAFLDLTRHLMRCNREDNS